MRGRLIVGKPPRIRSGAVILTGRSDRKAASFASAASSCDQRFADASTCSHSMSVDDAALGEVVRAAERREHVDRAALERFAAATEGLVTTMT